MVSQMTTKIKLQFKWLMTLTMMVSTNSFTSYSRKCKKKSQLEFLGSKLCSSTSLRECFLRSLSNEKGSSRAIKATHSYSYLLSLPALSLSQEAFLCLRKVLISLIPALFSFYILSAFAFSILPTVPRCILFLPRSYMHSSCSFLRAHI